MKKPARIPISTKIELNKDKIYRVSDPIQLAEIFFPSKNACNKRAAFLAILFEIKNTRDQKLFTTDHIAEKYSLTQSSVTKARTKMTRIGMISKRNGCWIFSSVFEKTLSNLITKTKAYQMPSCTAQDMNREKMYIEIAKNMK